MSLGQLAVAVLIAENVGCGEFVFEIKIFFSRLSSLANISYSGWQVEGVSR